MNYMSLLAHLFIPHESNNYKARILHLRALVLFSVVFLFLQLLLSSVLYARPQVLGYASQISPEKVVELINNERSKKNLSPLTINPLLNEAALRKAGDMFAFNYWAHVSPSGRQPWDFFREVGYDFSFAGENLARDFPTPEDAVQAWIASPSHEENIVNSKYKETGVAVVDGTLGGVETTLIVQLFGTLNDRANSNGILLESGHLSSTEPVTNSNILANTFLTTNRNKTSSFNPFFVNKLMAFVVLGILAFILVLDGLYVWRKEIIRLSGKSMAHALFIFGVILIIILSRSGSIL